MRIIFLFIFLFNLAEARENPFFPVEGSQDLTITTNQPEKIEVLKRASIILPSSARVIEKVTVTYKNLDGSVAKKSTILNEAIDWHLPIFISQSMQTPCKEKKKKRSASPFKTLANYQFIRFEQKNKQLNIITRDPLIRHFLIVNPHRIVLDFKRDADFRTYIKELKNAGVFKKIVLGNHNRYYRVVVYLDGQYRYRLKKAANSIAISLY